MSGKEDTWSYHYSQRKSTYSPTHVGRLNFHLCIFFSVCTCLPFFNGVISFYIKFPQQHKICLHFYVCVQTVPPRPVTTEISVNARQEQHRSGMHETTATVIKKHTNALILEILLLLLNVLSEHIYTCISNKYIFERFSEVTIFFSDGNVLPYTHSFGHHMLVQRFKELHVT